MLSEEQMKDLLVRLEMATRGARSCPGPNRRGSMSWVRAYENDVTMLVEEIQSLQADNADLKSLVSPTTNTPTIVPIVVQKFQLPDNNL